MTTADPTAMAEHGRPAGPASAGPESDGPEATTAAEHTPPGAPPVVRSSTTDPDATRHGVARAGAAARVGRVLVVGTVAGTAVVVVLRGTAVQELHAVLLGLAGASGVLLGLLVVAGVAGAVLTRGGSSPGWLRSLAVALPLVAVLQVSWPGLVGMVRPEDASRGREFTVVAQNVWRSNPDLDAAAREVLATDADVLVVSEMTVPALAAFRRAGAFEEYPYRVLRRRDDTQGMAVLSRVPLVRARRQPPLFRLVVRLQPPGARPVTLVAVHLPAPNHPGAVPFWQRELDAVASDARAAGGSVVVAGDFNAGPGHLRFRRMADAAGLRSAQDHGGGGLRPTFPESGRPLPPVLRLDHVMVGADVGVSGFAFLPRIGADHLGVEARLRVPAA